MRIVSTVERLTIISLARATNRGASGIKGDLARKVEAGDIIANLPGTPHWLSEISDTIEYAEIPVPSVDPAPGVERAEVASASYN
jgi:hypothetical protein